MNSPITKAISAAVLRLRTKSPFFATLALFAKFIPSNKVETAATNGRDIYINPEYFLNLNPKQQDGLLLHEVLHAALLHVTRRGVRDSHVWNIAADIVTNGIIMQQSGQFDLPDGAIRDENLENFSVEEIYELLIQNQENLPELAMVDLLEVPITNEEGETNETNSTDNDDHHQESNQQSTIEVSRQQEIESHWRNALQHAAIISQNQDKGELPGGMTREFAAANSSQLDWRSYLWRYLVQTPNDFSGFDRRFIGNKLYLESLQGESLHVYVAIDTSGSINNDSLGNFFTEVRGILRSYPHVQCQLYFVDVEVYGPYQLDASTAIPTPEGGGGTSFTIFFEHIAQVWDGQTTSVIVYLTDGYGTFPEEKPQLPVLWVVTPGGLDSNNFPFGEVVRLVG